MSSERQDGARGWALYALFGGGMVAAGAVGALLVFFILRPAGASAPPASVAGNSGGTAPASPAAPHVPAGAAATQAAPVAWNIVATYGSWQVRCQNAKDGGKTCAAVLELIDNKSKRNIMAWIVGPDGKGALQSVFQTPTGVMVASGLDVKFGNGAPRHIAYVTCMPQQCTAAAAMDDGFVKDATAAQKADVVLHSWDGKNLDFGIPVAGLDKAVAALRK